MNFKVWIIEVGEPLPLEASRPRMMRAGQLSNHLADSGVEVTWWVSNFNHLTKKFYDIKDADPHSYNFKLPNGVILRFLRGRSYRKNVSIRRFLHNIDISADFRASAEYLPSPDVILCCYPTVDLAMEAVNYGQRHGIPVVIDIRDLWPDAFADVLNFPKWLVKLLIAGIERKAANALRNATALTAISSPILDWGLAKAKRLRREKDRVFALSYDRLTLSPEPQHLAHQTWRALGLKLDGTELIACCFGTISDVPEFETVIEALILLPKDLQEKIRVVICGSGPRLQWLQESAKVHKQLLIPGHVSDHAISTLMPFAFAGLLPYPSRNDLVLSFPNKIGEYLSAGLPIISTLAGVSAQLLNTHHCGVVVRNRDAHGFALALSQLSRRDENWHLMSANARQTYISNFDSKINYTQMTDYLLSFANCTTC